MQSERRLITFEVRLSGGKVRVLDAPPHSYMVPDLYRMMRTGAYSPDGIAIKRHELVETLEITDSSGEHYVWRIGPPGTDGVRELDWPD